MAWRKTHTHIITGLCVAFFIIVYVLLPSFMQAAPDGSSVFVVDLEFSNLLWLSLALIIIFSAGVSRAVSLGDIFVWLCVCMLLPQWAFSIIVVGMILQIIVGTFQNLWLSRNTNNMSFRQRLISHPFSLGETFVAPLQGGFSLRSRNSKKVKKLKDGQSVQLLQPVLTYTAIAWLVIFTLNWPAKFLG